MEYQKGSHIRMSQGNHAVAIPNHKPIKVGTLTKILKDVASRLNISIHEVINKL